MLIGMHISYIFNEENRGCNLTKSHRKRRLNEKCNTFQKAKHKVREILSRRERNFFCNYGKYFRLEVEFEKGEEV